MSKLVLNEMSAAPDTPSTGKAAIYVNATPALCVKSDAGVVSVLPAYSTGTWTPALKFGGASVGMTYNFQVGNWTQIGNAVFFGGAISLSAVGSSTTAATITGLPGTVDANTVSHCAIVYFELLVSLTGSLHFNVASGPTISLYQSSSGTATALTHANFQANTRIDFGGVYFVS